MRGRRRPPRSSVARTLGILGRGDRIYAVVGILGGLALWQLIGSGLNPIELSTPIRVAKAFPDVVLHGNLWSNLWLTMWTFALGLFLGMLGVPLGIATGRYRILRRLISPFIRVLYSIPIIALFPLFIIWFGTGVEFRLPADFLASFLPMLITVEAGVQTIDPFLIEAARVFGGGPRQVFAKVLAPATVPFIATGFKIAIGRTIVTTVSLEILASNSGLGYMLNTYGNQFQTADYFVPLVIIAVVSLLLYVAGDKVEQRFLSWRTTA